MMEEFRVKRGEGRNLCVGLSNKPMKLDIQGQYCRGIRCHRVEKVSDGGEGREREGGYIRNDVP